MEPIKPDYDQKPPGFGFSTSRMVNKVWPMLLKKWGRLDEVAEWERRSANGGSGKRRKNRK